MHPLAMLAIYTFVFSQVFKARWSSAGAPQGPLEFAINLFAGLIVFNLASECITRSPLLIPANPNFVKKIIFPLEILSAVNLASSLVHALTSLFVLMIFEILAYGSVQLTVLWLPVVWLPLILLSLSVSWILSAIGVYFRDLGQLSGVFMSALLFLSPIFFPLSALPARWQPFLALNPLSFLIEQTRVVVVSGHAPSFRMLLLVVLMTGLAAELSYRFFMRMKPGFADVI